MIMGLGRIGYSVIFEQQNDQDEFSPHQDLIKSFDTNVQCPQPDASDSSIGPRTCLACQQVQFDEIDGRACCTACGEVQWNIMDCAPEWRSFDGNRLESGRCGQPLNPLFENTSISTVSSGGSAHMKRLQVWTASSHRDLAKYKLFTIIQQKAVLAGITPAAVAHTQKFLSEAMDRMYLAGIILRGTNRQGLVAACLHFAFKRLECPRSCQEVAEVFAVSQNCVTSGIKMFGDIFKDDLIVWDDQPTDATQLIPRFLSRLGAPPELSEQVLCVLRKVQKRDIFHNHIVEAQAAACIWNALTTFKLQKQHTKAKVGFSLWRKCGHNK